MGAKDRILDIRHTALNHRSLTPPSVASNLPIAEVFEEWALLPHAPDMFSAPPASKRTKGTRTEQQEDQDENEYQFLFTQQTH